jgi:hypothetical protein
VEHREHREGQLHRPVSQAHVRTRDACACGEEGVRRQRTYCSTLRYSLMLLNSFCRREKRGKGKRAQLRAPQPEG